MGRALPPELAWRVVWRAWRRGFWTEFLPSWFAAEVADPEHGLAVSPGYVHSVWERYWWTGGVDTHQGRREAPPANKKWDVESDIALLKSIAEHPRWQLKEHHLVLNNTETRQQVSYSVVCAAAWRLGRSRQKIRSVCYKADYDAADIFLADLMADYALGDLVFADETAKDMSVLKGSFGYAMRGEGCVCNDLPALTHGSRTSMLNIFSPAYGWLDHAFVDGTYNTELFLHVMTEPFVDHLGHYRRPILTDHVVSLGIRCLVIDNARIHKDAQGRFAQRLRALGCEVRFMPPYCWFLSPLDNGAYGRIVAWMRANPTIVACGPMWRVLEEGMRSTLSPDEAWDMCRRCGYTREA